MRKLLNDPDAFVDEMLEGLLLAHPDRFCPVDGEPRAIVHAQGGFVNHSEWCYLDSSPGGAVIEFREDSART